MATFGLITKGASQEAETTTYIRGTKATSGAAGNIVSITSYIKYSSAGAEVKFALYDESLNLVSGSETEAKTIGGAQDGWLTFNFASPVAISASTVYWFVFQESAEFYQYYNALGGYGFYKSQAYGAFPASISGTSNLDRVFSIYATYQDGATLYPFWLFYTPYGGIDAYTKLMLHMNGADASTTFTDSSSNGLTQTRYGDAQIDTAQSKFGGASGLFDGNGDYITVPADASWNFGSGNWTVDFWEKSNGSTSTRMDAVHVGDPAFSQPAFQFDFNDTVGCYVATKSSSSRRDIACGATGAYTDGNWHHIALVRNGGTITFYFDGTAINSNSSVGTETYDCSSRVIYVGQDAASHYWNGWLDEIRISVGIARWTSNFTPPTEEYTT